MSCTHTIVVTHPPPPPDKRNRLRSPTQILGAPTSPANGHAARGWPRESNGGPHQQVNEARGKGCQRRRRSNTQDSCGWSVVSGEMGIQVNGRPANGPCRAEKGLFYGCESGPDRLNQETVLHHVGSLLFGCC